MIPTYTFFAVGKGHTVLVQFSTGFNMLMDCRRGSEWPSPLQHLKSKIRTLDMLVVSHPHQDHIGGLQEVCEFFKPGVLWHNGREFRPDPVYDDWSYYERLRTGKVSYCRPIRVYEGYTTTIGDSRIYVAGPKLPNLQDTPEDENNNGIILAIMTAKSKIILTGDTEEEQWVATNLTPLSDASVFLASHHGREDGFSEHALATIRPQRVVISDGEPADTDATEKYERIAPVSTTRKGSVVVRASNVATTVN